MTDHTNRSAEEAIAHDAVCPGHPAVVRAARLEKEADWLAMVLANVSLGVPLSEYIEEDVNGMSPPAPEQWRDAARKTVEIPCPKN